MSDLGYQDCGGEKRVFFIWSWALGEVKPKAAPKTPRADETNDCETNNDAFRK